MLLYVEIAVQVVYLHILIVILVLALRKRKSNNSRCGGHETRGSVSVAGNDVVTSSSQITIDPTGLALNMMTTLS